MTHARKILLTPSHHGGLNAGPGVIPEAAEEEVRRNEGDLSALSLGERWEAVAANEPFFPGPLFPATLAMKGRSGSSIGCRKPPPHAAQGPGEHAPRPGASVDGLQCRVALAAVSPGLQLLGCWLLQLQPGGKTAGRGVFHPVP